METDVVDQGVDPPETEELSPRERPVVAASGLAVASLVLGSMAAVLGATLIWFFLALPLGIGAVICGLIERRSTRRRFGRAAGGIVTAGIVLGAIAVPLSLGGLVVIPRVEGFVERTIGLTQRDVSADLEELEGAFGDSVDDLDKTLTDNVNTSTKSLERDFKGLEASTQKALEEAEANLAQIVTSIEQATGDDVSSLEASVAADLRLLETSFDGDLRLVLARIDSLEAELATMRAQLQTDLRDVENADG